MNDQDYEQKKQECWEEFRKEHPEISCKSLLRNFVNFIFDRAYALDKQEKDAEEISSLEEEIHTYAKMCSFTEADYTAIRKAVEHGISLVKSDKEDTVIQGWVFVDETTFDRILCVRKVTQGEYEAVWDSGHPEFCLGEEVFPDMVPNTLPLPVEITIKRKKK